MQVHDIGLLAVPEGEDYPFLGAPAGAQVHAVPQVEVPGVVWLGWNTQDPPVVTAAPQGVTLRFHGVQGPGRMTLFLQPGNFAPPQLLVDGSLLAQPGDAPPQDLFVEINTHTHANWVFTEPGIYLVDIEARAQGPDGSSYSSSATVRFAIGDQVYPQDALGATWEDGMGPEARGAGFEASAASDAGGADPATAAAQEAPGETAADPQRAPAERSPTTLPWLVGGGIGTAALAAAGVAGLQRRRAAAEREAGWTGAGAPPQSPRGSSEDGEQR